MSVVAARLILLEKPRSPFDEAQGEREIELIQLRFSVHAEPVEAFLGVFQRSSRQTPCAENTMTSRRIKPPIKTSVAAVATFRSPSHCLRQ